MFNLLIGFPEGKAFGDRVVEHTADEVKAYIAPGKRIDPLRLVNLPTLVMPETGDSRSRQTARVGYVDGLIQIGGGDYAYRFTPHPGFPEIATSRIEEIADRLQITKWEFSRTHWAVKDIDLYRVLEESITGVKLAPHVFNFPTHLPREDDLVAVMMPFDQRFNSVYSALQSATTEAGLRCQRADEIWKNPHVMDDVIGLIWSARVVISDLSSKNPNVFYETGIAHSLGRDVIPIAQSIEDIPFDLRSLRAATYLANGEGLESLKETVTKKLKQLVA